MTMDLALLLGVCITFVVACFTAGHDAKPGVSRKNQ